MITQKDGNYYLRKRIPKRFASVEDRREVWISLATKDQAEAAVKAKPAWEAQLAGWEAMMAGDTDAAERRFEEAKLTAKTMGIRYITVDRLIERPVEEILERVEMIGNPRSPKSTKRAVAALGLAPEPSRSLSWALDRYWTLARDQTNGKSPDQLRRFQNPRKKVFKDFMGLVGDLNLADIGPEDTLAFRDWLVDLVEEGRIDARTANKQISYLSGVLRKVVKMDGLAIDLPLTGLTLSEGPKAHRPPFSTGWLKEHLLVDGALGGLNTQARCIVLALVNTGARPSEIAGIQEGDVILHEEIPKVVIRAEGRQLKNHHSSRSIPLAGVSLEALRECPVFPRYAGKDAISATVNKFLRSQGLLETDRHTLYSLRHSFEDRLLESGVDERVRSDLMGHSIQRQRYGQGGGDDLRYKAVQAIAL